MLAKINFVYIAGWIDSYTFLSTTVLHTVIMVDFFFDYLIDQHVVYHAPTHAA